jgi:hypothetical protein
MELLKKLGLKLFGKKIVENGIEKSGLSKTKLTALVGVAIVAVESLSQAWGHPVVVPQYIKEFLAGVGLWTLRDSIK